MTQKRITDNLQDLMAVLPPELTDALIRLNNSDSLLEIVLDLGRLPKARFVGEEVDLSAHEVTREEIDLVISKVGDFDADNRAGLERTLHRISAIRSRKGHIVGLTCRVGRAVYGTIDIIQDLLEAGQSILLLGKPGIGKTTMLRESARILAEKKRVVIVDTSNEIGGDGDVPHPAVGKARRMQVASPSLQHEVMIEAVENHNPEVIVIDEIGREMEAIAARTIAERGVQLVATAHGRTLENLLLNPTLSDLVGGIESVTLSDEEARRRNTQKTVLERRSPPTFDVLIEIQDRDVLAVHTDVSAAVDSLLRGMPLTLEIRSRDENDRIKVEKQTISKTQSRQSGMQGLRRTFSGVHEAGHPAAAGQRQPVSAPSAHSEERDFSRDFSTELPHRVETPARAPLRVIRIYPYGVARNRLAQAAHQLGVPAQLVNTVEEADVLITLRTYYRSRQQTIVSAEEAGMPIYVLRANTGQQMEQSLAEMFNLTMIESEPETQGWERVLVGTKNAIDAVLNGQRWVELPPAPAQVRRMQHEMARQAQLVSHSYGKEPNRRVRIFRE